MRKNIETTKPTQVSVPGVRGLEASRDTPGHFGSVMDGLESVLGFLGCFLDAILGVLKLFGCILGIKDAPRLRQGYEASNNNLASSHTKPMRTNGRPQPPSQYSVTSDFENPPVHLGVSMTCSRWCTISLPTNEFL